MAVAAQSMSKAHLITRAEFIANHHDCVECGAGHCSAEVKARWLQRLTVCADCAVLCIDDYMLKDEVWSDVATADERLHLRCFENRLGRNLTLDDLKDVPANKALRWAWGRGADEARG